ncbi:MAG TPA: oligosaccharide flippase family protein [Bryobacteraceae bacterium]|nr:oligosaccharide flippase family protein [Bryobacteraceae bacterium]
MASVASAVQPAQNAWRGAAEFAGYGGSVLLLQALRFGVNILCARLAGPSDWGLWTLLNTVLAYSYIADFGVVNGMNRDVALFRGRGDTAQVARIENTSKSLVLCTSVLCALVAAGFAFHTQDSQRRTVLLIFAVLLLFYKLFNFAQVYSMAHDDFTRVTKANFWLAAVTVPCVLLVFVWGLPGFLWAQVLSFAVGGYLYIAPLASNFHWGLDRAELARLAIGGIPIAAVGFAATFIGSIDRWLVAGFLGVHSVGHYSLVIMAWSTIGLVPQIIASRMYPRLAEEWGRTADLRLVARLLKQSTWVGLALTAPLVLAVEIVAPQIVMRFLPAYNGGIAAMRIAALGFLFQAVTCCYSNIFNVVAKQQYLLAVQALAAISTIAVTASLLALGWGLEGAAVGATFGSCIYCGGAIAAVRLLIRA